MRVREKSFLGAMCDEVQLADDAKKLVQTYLNDEKSLPLDENAIATLHQENLNNKKYPPDLLARVFYESLLQSDHRDFIDKLNSHSKQSIEQSGNIKIYLVPGMFYKEHPETGANGSLALEIADKFDFETCLVPIQSGGSVKTNSAIIEATLKQDKHSNIWLVSVSKGTSDVRHYLQHTEVNPNIKGWINVAGIPKGLPYVNYRLSTFFKRSILRLLSMVFPFDYQALLELKANHPFWSKQNWLKTIEMIHIVPIPHSTHLQGFLNKKYHTTLKMVGPNDGLVPLTDCLELPGHIIPIWGCDHFMRTSNMSSYLYQLYNYIIAKSQETDAHS